METTSPPAASPTQPVDSTLSEAHEIADLRREVQRLRALVGPSEESYRKLRLDVLGAKDAAIASEAQLGQLRGQIVSLQAEVVRLRRDYLWFRQKVVNQLLGPRTRRLLRPILPLLLRARALARR